MDKATLIENGFQKLVGCSLAADNIGIYARTINGLGFNLGIDMLNKKCFSFDGDRPDAVPYPIPARIVQFFRYPENEESLKSIVEVVMCVK